MSVKSLLNNTESSLLSIDNSSYFVINGNDRTITPPATFKNFGVESDENSNRVWFECPRFIGDNIDVTTLNVRVNYQNAKGDKDQYIVTDVKINGDLVHFSWLLSRKATMYSGVTSFIVCIVKTNSSGVITNEWNTTLCTGTVLGGLEVEKPEIPQDVTDVVNQLLDITNKTIVDVEELTTQAVENIKQTELDSIENVKNAPNSLFANAVKGSVSGEIIRVDDVSPVEHTVNVKVRGKNLCKLSGSGTKNGLTYSYENGAWSIEGVPTVEYAGIESMVITSSLEDGETYTLSQSQNFYSSGADGAIYLQVLIEDYVGNKYYVISAVGDRSFTVDKSKYKQYTLTIQCGTAKQLISVSNFTVQLEKGDVATEYEPYVDPTTVTLNRCGKNLLETTAVSQSTTGLDFIVYEDGKIKVNGSSTATTYLKVGSVNLKAGVSYTLSGCPSGGDASSYRLDLRNSDTSLYQPYVYDYGDGAIFTPSEDVTLIVGLRYFIDSVIVDKIFSPMIEVANSPSEYESYKGATYTPNSDGNVNVVSVSPTMTLFTDTENVSIECEYNRDTNLVIQELIERIKVLEGE